MICVKIYTKTGDSGETVLWRAGRVSKADPRIEAIGAVDELNAQIGLCVAAMPQELQDRLGPELLACQRDLFEIGAELADGKGKPRIDQSRVGRLEEQIDALSAHLMPLAHFILPGGSLPAAHLHAARTAARRAERAVVVLHRKEPVNEATLAFLNRLSDFLFVAARYANAALGVDEPVWSGGDM